MSKIVSEPLEALGEVRDGAVVAVGGFGPAGVPLTLINALLATGARELHVVTNNVGDGWGLGELLREGRIARLTMSYTGENKDLADRWLAGELEIEFTPQGTLVERLRAAGAGIPAFYTATGAGTLIADGGLPLRFRDGEPISRTQAREQREFSGRRYVLEHALHCDLALVHCFSADAAGNLRFRGTARNFNPVMATAATTTVAEAESVVALGRLAPDDVHLPGAFVTRVLGGVPANDRIDKLMTTEVLDERH
ncbi:MULTISPECIES: CoA transferase subunit A [unclassified Spirillospora]|uniref:CoA transferase subunit A n=1 Tax=unclassified Spirillospora TaxID=2642701 RepID=UPI00371614B8